MSFKYKDEWPRLVDLSNKEGLTKDQIYFLLALREVEDGGKGNEFNIKLVKDTNYKEQANWAIGSIKKNEIRWQNYIREQSHIGYVAFFFYFGGPYSSGWHGQQPFMSPVRINKINKLIEEIKNEFKGD